jgi:hypothetical protein
MTKMSTSEVELDATSRAPAGRIKACGPTQEITMNPFEHSTLRIEVDEVLDPAPLTLLLAGHTPAGQKCLIIKTAGDETTGTWLCTPITERALDCVLTGRAELRDVVSHTATGAVEVITVGLDGRCVESRKMSQELCDADLPPVGRRLVCT